jgi:hypothetical protein
MGLIFTSDRLVSNKKAQDQNACAEANLKD